MRQSAAAAVFVACLLILGHGAHAAGDKVPDYTGWQINVSGVEITKSEYHSSLAKQLSDRCTIIKRGSSRYIVKKNPWGTGLEQFSADLVSASTNITVSGGGKCVFTEATPPFTETWTYRMGPGQ